MEEQKDSAARCTVCCVSIVESSQPIGQRIIKFIAAIVGSFENIGGDGIKRFV